MNNARRRFFALLLLLLPGLAGCDGDSASNGNGPGSVRLGYFANLTHAQAVLGVSSGEFAASVAPAQVKTKVFNAGPSLIEALFAGEIDIAYVGPGPAISGHVSSRGEGLRIIAGAAANGVVIVARKDSGIKTLEDLKGKKIATPQLGNTQDIAAKHFVLNSLGQSDVKNVLGISNAEQAGLMQSGAIDAAWVPEPWGSRLIVEHGALLIGEEKDLWKEKQFSLALVITTPEFLAKHPDLVEKMLKVHRAWTARLSADPQKYVPQLSEALFGLTGKKLPEGVLPMAVKNVKFTDDPLDQTLTTMADWSFDLGFIPRKADLKGLADLAILRKLQASQ